ncbi:MAG: DUF3987 domain-containing protein [Gammaproteobacteria bacterium]|nr:DUF3987 domain-containing protein [Gammaproteobacteria bacterium]
MALQPRVLGDFLHTWEEYAKYLPAPANFKRWGGLFLISAALSRKVWVTTDPTFPPLFANLFILLVGPPGCGKDIVINKVAKLINVANEGMQQGSGFRMAGRSISAKGIIDLMAEDDSCFTYRAKVNGKSGVVEFHSVLVCVPELGTLLPVYNTQLVSFLNELYNCNEMFEEQIRGRGTSSTVKITNPHLAMLMGTQPTTLSETFPEQAFRMGFFSRTNIISTRKSVPVKLYDRTRPNNEMLYPKLVSDLRAISMLQGEFKTTPAFEKIANDFHLKQPDNLKHSRFEDYNTRRSLHLHKLAMICAISENSKMMLDVPQFERAKEYLYEAEADAPEVFDGIITSDGFQHSVEQALGESNTGIITHQQLERSLRRTHKPHEVGQIIRSMIGGEDIIEIQGGKGLPKYKIAKQDLEKFK